MSNCNINKIISDKLSVSKLTKTQEIDITIMSDIDSCLKINTRKFEKITGTSSAYTSRTIAPDLINVCESLDVKIQVHCSSLLKKRMQKVQTGTKYTQAVQYLKH